MYILRIFTKYVEYPMNMCVASEPSWKYPFISSNIYLQGRGPQTPQWAIKLHWLQLLERAHILIEAVACMPPL